MNITGPRRPPREPPQGGVATGEQPQISLGNYASVHAAMMEGKTITVEMVGMEASRHGSDRARLNGLRGEILSYEVDTGKYWVEFKAIRDGRSVTENRRFRTEHLKFVKAAAGRAANQQGASQAAAGRATNQQGASPGPAGAQSHGSEDEEPDCCSICLGEFQPGEQQDFLQCSHRFHSECLKKWLRARPDVHDEDVHYSEFRSKDCPVCRRPIVQSAAPIVQSQPARPADLPFGGDMQAAMRAGDRHAVRTLMAARDAGRR